MINNCVLLLLIIGINYVHQKYNLTLEGVLFVLCFVSFLLHSQYNGRYYAGIPLLLMLEVDATYRHIFAYDGNSSNRFRNETVRLFMMKSEHHVAEWPHIFIYYTFIILSIMNRVYQTDIIFII